MPRVAITGVGVTGRVLAAAAFAWLLPGQAALAQHGPHANISVPLNQTGDGFFEQIGVNFGFHAGNFFFQQNGGAAPPFGGLNPAAGLNTGFHVHAPGGFDGHFNLVAAQGAQTSLVGQSVTTTVPSGVSGFVADSSQTPFVLGAVPVVGEGGVSPLRERLERIKASGSGAYGPRGGASPSGASPNGTAKAVGGPGTKGAAQPPAPSDHPALPGAPETTAAGSASTAEQPPSGSVTQLQQRRAAVEAAQQQDLQAMVLKAQQAEAAGKPGLARIFYRQAAQRAASPLKEQLLIRAARLAGPATAKPASPSKSKSPPQAAGSSR